MTGAFDTAQAIYDAAEPEEDENDEEVTELAEERMRIKNPNARMKESWL